jgi:hypothetical protein
VIDDGEEGGVRAETHGERGAHGQCECSLLRQQANRQLEIAADGIHPHGTDVADRFSRLCDATELESRHPPRLRQGHAAPDIGVDWLLEMKAQLVFELTADLTAPSEPS